MPEFLREKSNKGTVFGLWGRKTIKRNEAFLRTTGITQSKCNQGFNLTYYYDELFVSDFREFPLKI